MVYLEHWGLFASFDKERRYESVDIFQGANDEEIFKILRSQFFQSL